MFFALGYLAGLITATLIVATLAYFRKAIEKHIKVVERVLAEAGPQPRGFVYEPPDEASEAREEIIRKNRAMGRDTPHEELRA